jgi:NAD(P)-dependent dehydrogenase (short-subunit alcohol dehydrogenase family)
MLDVQEEKGQNAAGILGPKAYFLLCDVRNETQVQAAVQMAKEKLAGVHGLINCAGLGPAKRVVGKDGPHPLDAFEQIVQVNLIGTFNTLRLAANEMQKNTPNTDGERGIIINTASVAAFDGQIGQAAYAASKGGIVSMTLPIAREFAQLGIRVNCIAPGIFETPLLKNLPQEVQDSLANQIPFPKRLGKPAEYANLVKHMIENTMLNGEVVRLDGAIRMGSK